MFQKFNPNPKKSRVGDCVIRAICTAMNMEWRQAYIELADLGLQMGDMPSSNVVWGTYLYEHGFNVVMTPNFCPDCYTIRDFCRDHPNGVYVLGTGTHVVCAIDGIYYDTWDSGAEVVIYYFYKEV